MVTEKRISRMKRTFFIDNEKNMFVLSILQTVSGTSTPVHNYCKYFDFLYNWKTIFWIKHVNFKLPIHGNKDNNWEYWIPNVQEVQMFIQTYFKFYQEYSKMVCSI